jgi:hypothetical protein
MVDPQIRNRFGRCESNIDSHAPAAAILEP